MIQLFVPQLNGTLKHKVKLQWSTDLVEELVTAKFSILLN